MYGSPPEDRLRLPAALEQRLARIEQTPHPSLVAVLDRIADELAGQRAELHRIATVAEQLTFGPDGSMWVAL